MTLPVDSPAKIMQQWLIAESHGNTPGDVNVSWPVYIEKLTAG